MSNTAHNWVKLFMKFHLPRAVVRFSNLGVLILSNRLSFSLSGFFKALPCGKPFLDLLIFFIKGWVLTNSKMTFFQNEGNSNKQLVYVNMINET